MTDIDHKKILTDRVSARLGRRDILKGVGAGIVAATASGGFPAIARAQQSGHITDSID
jgi:peptide/nickel transport system substrate-binding protein